MQRHIVAELMDSPTIDAREHLRALDGLRRLNNASHAARTMAAPILHLARRHHLNTLSILDIASGGGDVVAGIAQRAQDVGIATNITLLDASDRALERAAATIQNATATANGAACKIAATIQGDALAAQLPSRADAPPSFDVITCSLFLHHLYRADVVVLLARMVALRPRLIVISDLRRTPAGLALAWTAGRILSRSPTVHFDAPASVRAAWTMQELSHMAHDAGLIGARTTRCWPQRMLLTWEPQGAEARDE